MERMNAALPESWTWRSWVNAANEQECGFPLQNLPFCAFEQGSSTHLGLGIGDQVLDLQACVAAGVLDGLVEPVQSACKSAVLNGLMGLGPEAVGSLRQALMQALRHDAQAATVEKLTPMLLPMRDVRFRLPVAVGNYTDFYASIHHAANVGRLFRPDQPLLPNYKHVPIGYHGRASSIVVSGTPIVRPRGQIMLPSAAAPVFEATRQLDYELELGAYIATGNPLGRPVGIDQADDRIFGVTLVNDWSARDIQAWEYQPLGPFLGKSFATTVSPWVVSREALEPFRVPIAPRPAGDPEPLLYLRSGHAAREAMDVEMESFLSTAAMREQSMAPVRLSASNVRELYWSFAQMIAHHTSNGCNLCPGDLIASGTVSGLAEGAEGCLLELTRRATAPVHLPTGETRGFLEDGDEVILRGACQREGLPPISLGECRGIVVPAAS